MLCYYHPDRPAVGVCAHCQRGVCSECAAVVEDVLACKDRHESLVRDRLDWEATSRQQSRRARANFIRNAVLYGLVGIVFSGYGWLEYRFLGLQAVFLILIGIFLLFAAAANFLESRGHR